MKIYALMVARTYEDHQPFDSARWNDEQIVGLFYEQRNAEDARKSLIEDILKDDKRFRNRLAIAEHSFTKDGDVVLGWHDYYHHDEFILAFRIKEFETGRLFNTEAL